MTGSSSGGAYTDISDDESTDGVICTNARTCDTIMTFASTNAHTVNFVSVDGGNLIASPTDYEHIGEHLITVKLLTLETGAVPVFFDITLTVPDPCLTIDSFGFEHYTTNTGPGYSIN